MLRQPSAKGASGDACQHILRGWTDAPRSGSGREPRKLPQRFWMVGPRFLRLSENSAHWRTPTLSSMKKIEHSSSQLKAKLTTSLSERFGSCGLPTRWKQRMQRLQVSRSFTKRNFLKPANGLRRHHIQSMSEIGIFQQLRALSRPLHSFFVSPSVHSRSKLTMTEAVTVSCPGAVDGGGGGALRSKATLAARPPMMEYPSHCWTSSME